MIKKTFKCAECGERFAHNGAVRCGNDLLCSICAKEFTVCCGECGVRIHEEEDYGDFDKTLCEKCYDESYVSCRRCGAVVKSQDAVLREADEQIFCKDCFQMDSEKWSFQTDIS
ncbi:hypothetical protein NE562_00765 [Butyricicoccus faecihominis]|uniref:hypothetical protein n=1 Tax=Butyricicoccus faecihominis TaxID=1712515 RepID=UPI00247A21F8|nr:hypothetical protein [Butyricicoccus faecihominis]MCQ5128172.1 hypothetical protein [Butyricicoccus faecihominis]